MSENLEKKVDKILSELESHAVRMDKNDTKVDKMLIKLIDVEESLKDVVTKKEFTQKTDEILTAIDGVVKDNDDIKIEQTSNIAAHDRFEKRITRVETRLNLKPAV